MKTFITVILTLSLTKNVFAVVVNGIQASNLRTQLIEVGAEAQVLTDASFVNVKNVLCHQDGGFLLSPMKCEFVDENSGRLEEVMGKDAEKLNTSLKNAGAAVSFLRNGELTLYKAKAKSISCSTSAIPRLVSCELVK